jgi:glycosyltransferase involved in cell wall biosynthesis
MKLHLLSIPHTVTRGDFAHCAFTGKVLRFSRMMRDHHVIHYGVEGSESGATEDVVVMDTDEHLALLGHPYHAQHETGGMYGDDAKADSLLYKQWNLYARDELKARVEPGDLILLPFGHAHAPAIRGLPILHGGAGAVESGIGYYDCLLPWRIYESEAVRHAAMGKEGRFGVHESSKRLEYVVPNYYDPADWPAGAGGDAVVFLGRLTHGKGLALVLELARQRPDVPFRIAGSGRMDDSFGDVPDNVEILGPLTHERADYLGTARAIIAPSRYVEPFCGTVVEAQLCGTPAITSNFGAFTETVEHGVTGLRCQTMREWSAALDAVLDFDRAAVRRRAVARYSLPVVRALYTAAFDELSATALAGQFPTDGWAQ